MSIETQTERVLLPQTEVLDTAPPPMYKVLLHNDDYTPMDFVVFILQQIFHKTAEQAEAIMLQVHHKGSGACGIFTCDVAATKVDAVLRLARANQHPLQCTMEPVQL